MSPPSSQQNKEKEGEREKEQEGQVGGVEETERIKEKLCSFELADSQPPEEKVLAVETVRR
jgi:hypothetical protein